MSTAKEVLGVVSSVCLLMGGVIVVVFKPDHDAARADHVAFDLRELRRNVETYRAQAGRYPTTQEGFAPLVAARVLPRWPLDPWGEPYGYELSGLAPSLCVAHTPHAERPCTESRPP